MAESTNAKTNRRTIRDLFAGHPMAAFIIMAFAISWVGWTLSYTVDLGLANGFGVIGSAGPALAAMIVSALVKPEPSGISTGKRWGLFGVIGVLALAVMVARRLWISPEWSVIAETAFTTAAYPSLWAFLVDVLAAAVVAFLLSGILSPRQGVRDLLRTLDPRRQPVRWYWWAIAVGLYPLVFLLGNAVSVSLGLSEPAPRTVGLGFALDVFLTFLYLLIGGGGLEEPGWRGFALPFLQKRYSPLRASLTLAVFWTLWHLPFFWFGGLQGGVAGLVVGVVVYFLVEIAPYAVLFTAIYNRTSGSLPIAILLHTSINTTYYMFQPQSSLAQIAWLALMVGIMLWMWRSPQTFVSRQV